MKSTYGMYKGRMEENPGKMMFRLKGQFDVESEARAYQAQLRAQGKKTRVEHFVGGVSRPWALYVMAPHDFWKKNFIVGRWK